MAGLAILVKKTLPSSKTTQETNTQLGQLGIGGGIGFMSGLVGIGGGIFLSPLLHLINWDSPKRIAAAASLFILVNSISGLLGQYSHHEFEMNWALVMMLLLSVIAGGQLGTRLGAKLLSENVIRRMTAILVIYVGLKLVLENGIISRL